MDSRSRHELWKLGFDANRTQDSGYDCWTIRDRENATGLHVERKCRAGEASDFIRDFIAFWKNVICEFSDLFKKLLIVFGSFERL